jgi:hypothetical protein
MPAFLLEPDVDSMPRQLRQVATGLADTAEIPRSKRPAPPPCYAPCEACGVSVLTGSTVAGTRLALDTHIATYLVQWDQGAPAPRLVESRGYPVHRCAALP